jgi:hypothetical protein
MRITILRWVLCGLGAGALGACTTGWYRRGCEADSTCPPDQGASPGSGSSGESGSGGASGAAGGGASSGTGAAGGGGSGGAADCADDPAEGPVAGGCGIWVSSTLGDDSHPGSQDLPVQTVAKAIALATGGPMRVYACGELYAEAVKLPAGVSLTGGFTCTQASEGGAVLWAWKMGKPRATLAPGPGLVPLTLLAAGADAKSSLVSYVEAKAAAAVEPGGSAIAVLALDGAQAVIRHSTVFAGNAADGADGDAGDHDGLPAQKGIPGNGGANACIMNIGLGGGAVVLHCDGETSTGGPGGDGTEGFAGGGGAGTPLPAPNPQGLGLGGNGEAAAPGLACTGGATGAAGKSGQHGLGGLEPGQITSEGYIGEPGIDGTPGKPGQAGGGGGASVGKPICGAAPHGGAGGGSGGTGGCGGHAGKGGQAGGSSFGIASRSTGIFVYDSTITTGKGGNGGKGGAQQLGGQIGLPGPGGFGFNGIDGIHPGCAGGAGGPGGNGGHGGGGHGGSSVPVAHAGINGVLVDAATIRTFGKKGIGGQGGNPDLPGVNGEDGVAELDHSFDL